MTDTVAAGSAAFINRELSWLAFNERVLEEAVDPSTPLLERVKFAAICASNLDEFFMVRVAALVEAVEEEDMAEDPAGLTPAAQLEAVRARARTFQDALYSLVVGDLLPALASRGIRIASLKDLSDSRRTGVTAFFRERLLPVLTPLAIDVSRPFPLVSSLSLNLAVLLEAAQGETERRLALVQVPPGLTRLVPIADAEGQTFVLLDEVIRAHLPELFPGQPIVESAAMRLARDSELELDDEGGRTHLELVEREVRRRRRSQVVRLEVDGSASSELVELLRQQVDVSAGAVYAVPGPLDLRVLMGLTELPGFDDLRDPPLQPVALSGDERETDIFSLLDERDVLLHHPYDAYDPVLTLLSQAADDPDVVAIKQTLYRASAGSSVIASLQRAAERNKQVTVLVELTARFDEERNIQWARALEEAGAHVIHGVRGYKTHAKICLIVRRTRGGLRRYVHLGTGNYNERTARTYTDFGLMTSSQAIAEDATAFFNALTGYSDPPRLKKLVMAPTDLRARLMKLIERERRRAEAGQPAEIVAKMNSLLDEDIIRALYRASEAGVRICLNVRGICALRPGVEGLSTNILVVSIVDRFLEHSRIFYFLGGGDDQVFLSSADWMTRNLDRRIELMFPVEAPEHKAAVLTALRAMFRDNVKARVLQSDGRYVRRLARRSFSEGGTLGADEEPFRVQQFLQDEARRRVSLMRSRTGVTFRPERAKKGAG